MPKRKKKFRSRNFWLIFTASTLAFKKTIPFIHLFCGEEAANATMHVRGSEGRHPFSPSTICRSPIELGSSGLAKALSTCWVILLAPFWAILRQFPYVDLSMAGLELTATLPQGPKFWHHRRGPWIDGPAPSASCLLWFLESLLDPAHVVRIYTLYINQLFNQSLGPGVVAHSLISAEASQSSWVQGQPGLQSRF